MSAAAHVQAALSHSAFTSPALREAVDHLLSAPDKDLDRAGFQPSPETQESLRELLRILRRAPGAPQTFDEEEQDVDRLS